VDAWIAVQRKTSAEHNVDALRMLRGESVGPYHPLYNHLFRDIFRLFHHYPCTYACAATRLQAGGFLRKLETARPRFSARLTERFHGFTLLSRHDAYLHYAVDSVETAGARTIAHGARLKLGLVVDAELTPLFEATEAGPCTLSIERNGWCVTRAGETPVTGRASSILPFWFSER